MTAYTLCMFLMLMSTYIECTVPEYIEFVNRTDPATRQLYEFRKDHPKPIGIWTTSTGKLVEIRETVALNTDPFYNIYHVDANTNFMAERVPERVVHGKGTAAFGYFEVTHDVSMYTKAEVFNGVGKKTPLVARFSTALQNLGGIDASRENKGVAFKMYTKEGNLDLLCLNYPVFFYREPNDFIQFMHAYKRNPKPDLIPDQTARFDFVTKRPDTATAILWLYSDYGIPNGYRKMDAFAIHTYVIISKKKERYFARFNFRSEQGIENLSNDEAAAISGRDPDYYNRDLYNAIEEKNYPSWRLDMDILTFDEIRTVDYNPFDVTTIWKRGTYKTVTIGRVVLDRNPDNFFAVSEQSAFNPGNLVPGIPGPIDVLYKTRRQGYRDTQMYRMGINHNKIAVNAPLYSRNYLRDGFPPVGDNNRDAPNYYPNSFSGPVPYIDPDIPVGRILTYQTNAIDLATASTFYNEYLSCTERERLANITAGEISAIPPFLQRRVIRLYTLIDSDLGRRLTESLAWLLKTPPLPPPQPIMASQNFMWQRSSSKRKLLYRSPVADKCDHLH